MTDDRKQVEWTAIAEAGRGAVPHSVLTAALVATSAIGHSKPGSEADLLEEWRFRWMGPVLNVIAAKAVDHGDALAKIHLPG